MRTVRLVVLGLGLGMLTFSCGNEGDSGNTQKQKTEGAEFQGGDDEFDDFDEVSESTTISLSDQALEAVIKSIPSPLEFSDKLVILNAEFNDKIIAKRASAEDFIGSHNKAIVMGIYGTDLSYINIFKENLTAAQYYSSVVNIAEDLRVDQFFNLETIDKLKSNEGNKEKVLEIIRSGYRDIHNYLKEQQRDEISLLMLYGSWLESLYLTLSVHNQQQIDLSEMIGDQKITVDKLLAIFKNYKSDKKIQEIIAFLNTMKETYQSVSISYEYDDSYTEKADDQSEDVDLVANEIKKIEITEDDIKNIFKVLSKKRDSFFNS
ncbi:MAG: hypothetical protein MRY83_16845 [Flavobacteriales bacterium]|nr:hypothetical protein [Flavobacteriales bacterium]